MKALFFLLFAGLPAMAGAGELSVNLDNAPPSGRLVFQLYQSASAFGALRDPAREIGMPVAADGRYLLTDIPAGTIALLVYADRNDNGVLDKSFIGVPREPVAFSNNYQPKGPPSFSKASFLLVPDETRELSMQFFSVLGERGRLGLGLGLLGQSSPYLQANDDVYQPIPAITYVGERLQWFGPTLKYGIAGSGRVRLALAADYRIGAYEEDDADILSGLGDRDGTLMAGLSLQYDMPRGVEMELAYQHDVLNRIGGGRAFVEVSRGFQAGVVRFEPFLSATWQSDKLTSHDFGVPGTLATPARPAYDPGSAVNYDLGVGGFVELSDNWRIIATLAGEFLTNAVTDSPIVDDDVLVKGFAAIAYVF